MAMENDRRKKLVAAFVAAKVGHDSNLGNVILALKRHTEEASAEGSRRKQRRLRSPMGMGEAELSNFYRHFRMSFRQFESLRGQVRQRWINVIQTGDGELLLTCIMSFFRWLIDWR